jgi:hypothetical protein
MRPAVGHFGIGAAPWQILGRTVIGEMLASTLIAILLIPVMFYLVEKASHRHGKGKQKVLPTESQGALQPARFCGTLFPTELGFSDRRWPSVPFSPRPVLL